MNALVALQSMSVLMFGLFGVATLVGVRIFGGARSAMWFAAANLLHALSLLLFLLLGQDVRWLPVGGGLLLLSFLLLHRSFAELLDRPKLLWWAQVSVLVAGVVAQVLGLSLTRLQMGEAGLASLFSSVELALTSSIVFSFSGDEAKAAGRFVGISMTVYALLHALRAEALLGAVAGRQGLGPDVATLVCVLGGMAAGAAVAFGFVFLSSSKQRLELLWRAQIDELTGLLNRWAFKRIAVKEMFRSARKSGALSVLMMDLDGMKKVNDRLGHSCGDAVLQAISGVLQEAVRERDSIARMGGDEFCILLPDTDLPEGLIVAERLRQEIDALGVRYRGETVKVRASFGVSCTQQCGWEWQTLVDRSDAALYEAKRGGNERVVAAQGATDGVKQELALQAPERRRRG